MENIWQPISMGTFLNHRKEFFTIDDLARYKRARIQLHGKGIVLRDEVNGAEVKTKQQQTARTGEFLVAEIDAKVGGFGIVPPELSGAVVSSHYFLFGIDEEKCLVQWLEWYIRSGLLEDQVTARGSTNYSAIRPHHVLNFTIPLPPIEEQRRIIARIETLAERITAAQELRKQASEEAEALWLSGLHKLYEQYYSEMKTLDDYASFISDGPHITPVYVDNGIPFVTVRNIANRKLSFDNLKYISREQHEIYCKRVKPEYGDVLYTKDGTLGVPCFVDTDKEFSFFVSVAIIKPKRDLLDGRFLFYFLDAPQVHEQVTNKKTGAVLQHIVIRAIKGIRLPIPPLDEQHRIVAYLDKLQAKVAALRSAQTETERELAALMPSVLDRAFKGEL